MGAAMGDLPRESDFLSVGQVLCEEAVAIHSKRLDGKTGAELNRELNALSSNALCLSGGGIRSAAFALGVIQAFASQPRSGSQEPGSSGRADESPVTRFHYLSTVSGG